MNGFKRFFDHRPTTLDDGSFTSVLAAIVFLSVAASVALVVANPAAAQSAPVEDADAGQLKAAYIACERLAANERLDEGTAMTCSITYEALKARVFGGSYDALLAWWETEVRGRFVRDDGLPEAGVLDGAASDNGF